MSGYDEAKFALEAASGGKNTLLLDDLGYPSVMVRIPAFRWCDVVDGGEDKLCSAFVVGGAELDCIYISKYMNIIEFDRAYSLPARAPANYIALDEARAACAKKGRGWHLMTNAEWMAIAHWSRKNGTLPAGNNDYGRSVDRRHETGVRAEPAFSIEPEKTEMILSGTGPVAWSHDGTSAGIYDLHGNLWDHLAGARVKDGELQVIPDNDSAMNVDEGPESPLWKAIHVTGALVSPGSAETYKYDGVNEGNEEPLIAGIPGGVKLSTRRLRPQYTGIQEAADYAYVYMYFQEMCAETELSPHVVLRQLGFYPPAASMNGEYLFVRNYGERYLARGGSWYDRYVGGMFDTYLRDSRAYVYPDLGFRAAFAEL